MPDDGAAFPWANQHDRYWESAVGASDGSLSCDWLQECRWRVSTLDPGGGSALRHFARPLRFHDVLGVSKGGFLVGTTGLERSLAPFALALRSLPPVVLPDLPGGSGTVRIRGGEWNGIIYTYAVNTGDETQTAVVPLSPGATDTVRSETESAGGDVPVRLSPGELRVWTAPAPGGGLAAQTFE